MDRSNFNDFDLVQAFVTKFFFVFARKKTVRKNDYIETKIKKNF
jgi:hypothetical protein